MQLPSAPALGVGARRADPTVAQVLPEADEDRCVAAYHFVVKRSYSILPGQMLQRRPRATPLVMADAWFEDGGALRSSLRHPSDLVPPKAGCEVVVEGHCHPPGGESVDVLCALQITDAPPKQVRVLGDRAAWLPAGEARARYSAPRTFGAIPLRWELAYGGVDHTTGAKPFPANPLGRGFWLAGGVPEAPPEWEGSAPAPAAPVGRFCALPNLVQPSAWPGPDDLLVDAASVDAAPAPVGFGWRSRHWAGVQAPLLAPADQVTRPLQGGDRIELTHMHPRHPRLAFQVPLDRPRVCWNAGWGKETVKLQLDTVFIQPDRDAVDLVWRGTLAVPEDRRRPDVVPRLVDVDGAFLPWSASIDEPLSRRDLER